MRPAPALLLTAAVGLLVACNKEPKADTLPVWTPADHDQSDTTGGGAVAPPSSPPPARSPAELGLALWEKQCALCHGQTGRGDGPMASAVRPPNMTAAGWQKGKTDAQLMESIRNGKGAMPAFKLPDDVMKAAIAVVRGFGEK